jgi:hypothetical protein
LETGIEIGEKRGEAREKERSKLELAQVELELERSKIELAQSKLETARAMIDYGDSIEKASIITGISIKELRKQLGE